jgi:hypothetical protein
VHVVRELPCRVIHGCEAIEERVQEVARVECCGRIPFIREPAKEYSDKRARNHNRALFGVHRLTGKYVLDLAGTLTYISAKEISNGRYHQPNLS